MPEQTDQPLLSTRLENIIANFSDGKCGVITAMKAIESAARTATSNANFRFAMHWTPEVRSGSVACVGTSSTIPHQRSHQLTTDPNTPTNE